MSDMIATLNEDNLFVDSTGKVIDNIFTCDWQSTPEDVIESINDLLEDHGLRLVEYQDAGLACYIFSLVKTPGK